MSGYVIESGIAEHGTNPNWIRVGRADDRDSAYVRMVLFALDASRGLYEPHGGRKLRVREINR